MFLGLRRILPRFLIGISFYGLGQVNHDRLIINEAFHFDWWKYYWSIFSPLCFQCQELLSLLVGKQADLLSTTGRLANMGSLAL